MTIFISSHILGELSKIATHYGIIKDGRMMQQITAGELSNKLDEYLCVRVDDANGANALLKKSFTLVKSEVKSANELHLYSIKDSGKVTGILSAGGFTIREIFLYQQDLESYFLDYMGGADNA